MNCPWCHKETNDGAKFCSWCGLKIPPPEELARIQAERQAVRLQSATTGNPVWAPRPPKGCDPDYSLLRPLSIGEIFDHSVLIYRRKFGRLTTVFAALIIPAMVVEAAGKMMPYFEGVGGWMGDVSKSLHYYGTTASFFWSVIYALGMCFANALAVRYASDVIMGSDQAGAAMKVAGSLGSIIGTFILVMAAIGISAIGFFIPALIVAIMFMFWMHVIVVEGRGGIAAMRRSSFLISGYWWKSFVTMFFGGVFAMGLSLFPAMAADLLKPFMDDTVYKVVAACASNAGMIISLPVCAVLMTVLYYDIRVRREGLDIECSCDALWP